MEVSFSMGVALAPRHHMIGFSILNQRFLDSLMTMEPSIWWFPKIGGIPSHHHPFRTMGIFPWHKQSSDKGVPHLLGKLQDESFRMVISSMSWSKTSAANHDISWYLIISPIGAHFGWQVSYLHVHMYICIYIYIYHYIYIYRYICTCIDTDAFCAA